MLLCNRRIILLGLLPLATCGFDPVYKTDSAASNMLGKISVQVQNSRNSFEFRDRLIERLGFPQDGAPYLLSYTTNITDDDLVVNESDNITRFTLEGVTEFQLIDVRSGAVVYNDTVRSNTSYSATSGTFQTSIAERDANVRLVRDLAEKIVTRLSITAQDWLK